LLKLLIIGLNDATLTVANWFSEFMDEKHGLEQVARVDMQ